jgi:uncharacterized protein YukE
MPHITHKTPTAYYTRHADWYKGIFRELCHAWGLQAELVYYLQMEKECVEIYTTWAPMSAISMGLLNPLRDWFIALKKNAYEKNYLAVYDEGAVGACKFAEGMEGQFSATFNKIKEAYDNAVAQAQNMVNGVADYINKNINPALQNAQAQVNNVVAKVNGEITSAVNAAQQKANDVKADLNNAVNKLNQVVGEINAQAQKITNLDGKAKQTLDDFNRMLADINKHTAQIGDLYQKIGQSAPSQPIGGQIPILETLKQKLGLDQNV